MRTEILSLSAAAAIAATPVSAGMMERGAGVSPERPDCRIIEEAARTNRLPVSLLTRLLWTESHFQADALSPKGARGVAQFMPETADERGLSNPFDPAEAIPQAARFLADLDRRFENSGLAIAAYNAGSKRVSDWLANTGSLPKETQNYVLAVTGHSIEEWAAIHGYRLPVETQSCLALSTSLASHPFKRLSLGQSSDTPYRNPDGLRESPHRGSQYFIGYHKLDASSDYNILNSQYYTGYHKPDGSSDRFYASNSQYSIGYGNSDR
jgi:hypothetical protein